jgi:ribonuclease PH
VKERDVAAVRLLDGDPTRLDAPGPVLGKHGPPFQRARVAHEPDALRAGEVAVLPARRRRRRRVAHVSFRVDDVIAWTSSAISTSTDCTGRAYYPARMRPDGRRPDELRPIEIQPGFIEGCAGSALVSVGKTRLICTASIDEFVPGWMRGKGRGWVTAEYGMLPGSTGERRARDISKGKLDGRSSEIQRLIGRSLRAVTDLDALGERSIWVDCDVIQADGGTRCAGIVGGYVALALACNTLVVDGKLPKSPLRDAVAAISVGIVAGEALLDLNYPEDSTADVDMNVVMTGDGQLVEVQSTAEGRTFSREDLVELVDLALGALPTIGDAQRRAIGE